MKKYIVWSLPVSLLMIGAIIFVIKSANAGPITSCAQVSIKTIPTVINTFSDGSAAARVLNFSIKNTGTCDFKLYKVALNSLSQTGSFNFAKAYLFDASTNLNLPTSNNGSGEVSMGGYNQRNVILKINPIFASSYQGTIPFATIPAGQTKNFYISVEYIRNTMMTEQPGSSASSAGISDYFGLVINSIVGTDANFVTVNPTYLSKTGNIITVN